ncbi:thioredoxin-like domain-containing protein [Alistipes sp.]|uniref:thioredoxin-like domain-containing protein n=1 Tax=Alistipes sp. TaxID=1872444 RepID=UPI003AEF45D8
MKNILILAAAAALCSCAGKNAYTIQGNVAGATGTAYLFDQQQKLLDSAAIDNGTFRFKGTADTPEVRYITDSRGDVPATFSALLIVEPGTITVADNPDQPKRKIATGTPSNDASAAYNKAGDALVAEYRNAETTPERREAIEKEYDELTRKAVETNRDNYFGAILLAQSLGYDLSGQELLDEIALFSPEMQQTELLTKLKTSAEQKLKTEVGQPYMDIIQNNADGEAVSLKSVVENPANKYTLVDFWASWCGPCMGEVPHLKKTYDEFHKKGFEIYGVSFDKDREAWLGAIDQNGMGWVHVSELNGFDNQAAKEYAVQGIPSNFLIDAQGVIVASNLRGEALYEKINELLGK